MKQWHDSDMSPRERDKLKKTNKPPKIANKKREVVFDNSISQKEYEEPCEEFEQITYEELRDIQQTQCKVYVAQNPEWQHLHIKTISQKIQLKISLQAR